MVISCVYETPCSICHRSIDAAGQVGRCQELSGQSQASAIPPILSRTRNLAGRSPDRAGGSRRS